MKRLLLVLLIASLFFPSCRPLMEWIGEDLGNDHYTKWYTKNVTGEAIKISTYDMTGSIVNPGDSILVCLFMPPQSDGIPSFELLYDNKWRDADKQVIRIDIMSPDGELLRTWKSSERHLPGRQFFSESYWRRYEKWTYHSSLVDIIWVFDILPEDIVPAKPEP